MNSSFLVTWALDVDEAKNPRQAAHIARAEQVRPGSWADVFDVKNLETGEVTRVDLSGIADDDYQLAPPEPQFQDTTAEHETHTDRDPSCQACTTEAAEPQFSDGSPAPVDYMAPPDHGEEVPHRHDSDGEPCV